MGADTDIGACFASTPRKGKSACKQRTGAAWILGLQVIIVIDSRAHVILYNICGYQRQTAAQLWHCKAQMQQGTKK